MRESTSYERAQALAHVTSGETGGPLNLRHLFTTLAMVRIFGKAFAGFRIGQFDAAYAWSATTNVAGRGLSQRTVSVFGTRSW